MYAGPGGPGGFSYRTFIAFATCNRRPASSNLDGEGAEYVSFLSLGMFAAGALRTAFMFIFPETLNSSA